MNLTRLRSLYAEYPQQFWLLLGASFIDMVGNALIFPFFALFLTDKFNVSLSEVGVLFAIFSIAGIVGSTIGGALADRFGRKPMALFALIMSAASNMTVVLVPNFTWLYVLAPVIGLVGAFGQPAWQAMLADLLPEDKRAEGFGLLRMFFNVAVMFGPMIGGLLAGVSYLLLFSVDAVTSIVTAIILAIKLRETRPADEPGTANQLAEPETLTATFRGYGRVLRDGTFMAFVGLGTIAWLVYHQMNTTLAVFLRDEHDFSPQSFGLLIGMNALMVVIMQFWITRKIRGYAPLLVSAVGVGLYTVGFGMYGFVSGALMFILAMIIITLGEMIAVPVFQAIAANLAPTHMRGRYMAVLGFSGAISGGLGTWLAGQIILYLEPEWVWYLAGIAGAFAALGYVLLYQRTNLPVFGAEAAPEREPALDTVPEAAL